MYLILLVILIICLIILMPIALIWAINTLFLLTIPISLTTWLATLILSAPFTFKGK